MDTRLLLSIAFLISFSACLADQCGVQLIACGNANPSSVTSAMITGTTTEPLLQYPCRAANREVDAAFVLCGYKALQGAECQRSQDQAIKVAATTLQHVGTFTHERLRAGLAYFCDNKQVMADTFNSGCLSQADQAAMTECGMNIHADRMMAEQNNQTCRVITLLNSCVNSKTIPKCTENQIYTVKMTQSKFLPEGCYSSGHRSKLSLLVVALCVLFRLIRG